MYNVKTLDKISKYGTERLAPEKYTIGAELETPEAILVRSTKMHDYTFNPELLCIARAGAGVNNIPLDRCAEEGIVVFNTPGANAEAVKELVLCSMFLAARDVVGGVNWVQTIKDDPAVAELVEKGKSNYTGPEIYGKTLGVVGLGAIGYKTANAAVELGMDVLGYDPYITTESACRLSPKVKYVESLDAIFRQCDYITLHVPATDATLGMVNEKTIAQMKDGVRVINMARAELVNDDDIIAALKDGKVACYVTDFPTAKSAGAAGVIAIPHLGASTPESEDNCAVMAADEIKAYLEHGNIINSVNLPNAYMDWGGHVRVCFIHKNSPAVLQGVLAILAENGLGVESMVEKSRGQYGYGMIDVNGPVTADLAAKLQAVEGIIRIRVIG
ncbi:MAG: 3-phosphoglycerate dehydrogenase family protein [Oscillospiraceae bacterium]|nr:3-phosphoglycerate dehydrogenase family protein [Oscillospiraceae bacterium]